MADGGVEVERREALDLEELGRRLDGEEVRDVAVVEVLVSSLGVGEASGGAVALVPESVGGVGRRGVHEGGADGGEGGVVAGGGVGVVEDGVAEVVGLRRAAAEVGVKDGEVETRAALEDDPELGGGDDGMAEGGVGEAGEDGTGAFLGVGDEAAALAMVDGGVGVGGVEGGGGGVAVEPKRGVVDSA